MTSLDLLEVGLICTFAFLIFGLFSSAGMHYNRRGSKRWFVFVRWLNRFCCLTAVAFAMSLYGLFGLVKL